MRTLTLVALAGCSLTHYGDVSIDPTSGPVGVGLTETYAVQQEICSDDCGPYSPSPLTATIESGSAAAVAGVDVARATVSIRGVMQGASTATVTGEGGVTTTMQLEVEPVVSTSLFVPLDVAGDGQAPRMLAGPLAVFAGSTFSVGQSHTSAGEIPLLGKESLALDSGGAGTSYDAACDCFTAGTIPGAATIAAALASLSVTVVDGSAIADFASGFPGSTITIYDKFDDGTVFLFPTAATGAPIIGAGPDATVAIADPTLLYYFGNSVDGIIHTIGLRPLRDGTTTVAITWGNVTKTFTVNVIPPLSL